MQRKKHFILLLFICSVFSKTTAQQWGNYTLYSTMNGTTTYLIDTNNVLKHNWAHSSTNATGYSSYLLPGGTLLRSVKKSGTSFSGGPICGQVQKVDWNGTIIWDYVYSTSQYCSHHDICPMPNGNVLLIAYESKTAAEVIAAGCTTFGGIMWPDKIVEIQPTGATTGTVVWEWHSWDHLVQNVNPAKANYQTSIVDHPELLNINYNAKKDWQHMNGVSYNPMLDQIGFSCHNINEIYIIDHSTTTAEAASHAGGNSGKGGDILYRWGNPAAYSATGTQILKVVHDAHWNPENVPNAGYFGGYNNQGISMSASCADQVVLPYDGYNYTITPGSAYTPPSYTIRQASGAYNSNMGNYQVLPNGNMLITIATAGVMKEFDPNGNLLWSKTASGMVPKSFRYDSCYVFNAAPTIPTLSLNADTLYSTPAITYQWYFNGYQIGGANSQYYVASAAGNYKVRITDINGCVYQYSTDYYYTLPAGINSVNAQNVFKVYPNPANGIVNIMLSNTNDEFEITVTDQLGSIIVQAKNLTSIDLSKCTNGIYFITLKNWKTGSVTQKLSLIK